MKELYNIPAHRVTEDTIEQAMKLIELKKPETNNESFEYAEKCFRALSELTEGYDEVFGKLGIQLSTNTGEDWYDPIVPGTTSVTEVAKEGKQIILKRMLEKDCSSIDLEGVAAIAKMIDTMVAIVLDYDRAFKVLLNKVEHSK